MNPVQSIIHQKIVQFIFENSGFLFLWGFKIQMKINFEISKTVKISFGNLVAWHWKSFRKFFKSINCVAFQDNIEEGCL